MKKSHKKSPLVKVWNLLKKQSSLFWGCVAVLATWGSFFFYLWPRVLTWGARGIQSATTPYTTDWGAHLTYISVFAYRPVHAWLQYHPINIEKKFTYPFVADALSGMMMRLGLNHVSAVVIPSIVLSLILLIVLLYFYREQLQNTGLAVLALSLFFLNGGLGFIPTIKEAGCCAWMNVIISEFIPQRSMLLGFPITLLIIMTLLRWSKNDFKKVEPLHLVLLGLLSGFLFLIHPHSTLCLIIFCFFLFINSRKNWQSWVFYAAAAAVPLFIIQFLLFQGQFDYRMLRWQPGWIAHSSSANVNYLSFMFSNWGIFLPLTALALAKTKWLKNPLVLGALFIFFISNIISFQPWDWDNTKLFTWSYLILLIPVVSYLKELWQHKMHAMKIVTIALVILMAWSSIIDLYVMVITPEEDVRLIWSNQDIDIAKQFREISQPTDVVATASIYNHWVPALTGRQILLGRKAWSKTYGFLYETVQSDIYKIYEGSEATPDLLKKYNVSYVVIGPYEIEEFKELNQKYFNKNYPIVLSNEEYNVYYVK